MARFAWLILVLGVSLFLGYLLDPLVDALERWRIPRSLGILLLLVPLFGAIALVLALVLPPLLQQIRHLMETLPDLLEGAGTAIQALLVRFRLTDLAERSAGELPGLLDRGKDLLRGMLAGVLGMTRKAGSFLAALLLIPFLTFYFLGDYDLVRARAEELIPRKYHPWFAALSSEMDRLVGRWLRGILVVALAVGLLSGIGLFVLGVPYSLALGVMAGLLNLIPVVGFWISFLAAVLVGVATGGWITAVQVAGLYLLITGIESQILSPRIVGKAVGLHPVVVLLALVFFADLMGILGALMAVPLALLVTLLARQLRALYLGSDLYGDAR
jgi:predicted PurR-regulated permease PerM